MIATMIGTIALIWLITAVILILFFACVSAAIAKSKNRSELGWFFLGLVLGPFALCVALLPAKLDYTKLAQCLACGEYVKLEAKLCRHCGTHFELNEEDIANIEGKSSQGGNTPTTALIVAGSIIMLLVIAGIISSGNYQSNIPTQSAPTSRGSVTHQSPVSRTDNEQRPAKSVPRYDTEAYCKQIAEVTGSHSYSLEKSCLQMEKAALDSILTNILNVPHDILEYCAKIGIVTGNGSYSLMQSCIQMEMDAKSSLPHTEAPHSETPHDDLNLSLSSPDNITGASKAPIPSPSTQSVEKGMQIDAKNSLLNTQAVPTRESSSVPPLSPQSYETRKDMRMLELVYSGPIADFFITSGDIQKNMALFASSGCFLVELHSRYKGQARANMIQSVKKQVHTGEIVASSESGNPDLLGDVVTMASFDTRKKTVMFFEKQSYLDTNNVTVGTREIEETFRFSLPQILYLR